MSMNTIKENLKKLAGTHGKDFVSFYVGEVTAVNTADRTCDVTTVHSKASVVLESVALQTERSDGIIPIPAVGSTVLVGITTQQRATVLLYSDLESFSVIIEKTKFILSATGIIMNDGSHNGLVKGAAVTSEFNNLQADINQLKALIAAWVVIPADGGLALKTILTSWAGSALTPTLEADIENSYITHGNPT